MASSFRLLCDLRGSLSGFLGISIALFVCFLRMLVSCMSYVHCASCPELPNSCIDHVVVIWSCLCLLPCAALPVALVAVCCCPVSWLREHPDSVLPDL